MDSDREEGVRKKVRMCVGYRSVRAEKGKG